MMNQSHLLQPKGLGLAGIADFYNLEQVIPTSEVADIILIRSHVAYHMGCTVAEKAMIKPSRGHSYKVSLYDGGKTWDYAHVSIVDYYDHRNGVRGVVAYPFM